MLAGGQQHLGCVSGLFVRAGERGDQLLAIVNLIDKGIGTGHRVRPRQLHRPPGDRTGGQNDGLLQQEGVCRDQPGELRGRGLSADFLAVSADLEGRDGQLKSRAVEIAACGDGFVDAIDELAVLYRRLPVVVFADG